MVAVVVVVADVVFLMPVVDTPLVIGFLAAKLLTGAVVFFSTAAFTVRSAGFGAAVAVDFNDAVLDGDELDVRVVVAAGFVVDFTGAAFVGFFVTAVTLGSLVCAGDVDEATAATAAVAAIAAAPATAKRSAFGSSGSATSGSAIGAD